MSNPTNSPTPIPDVLPPKTNHSLRTRLWYLSNFHRSNREKLIEFKSKLQDNILDLDPKDHTPFRTVELRAATEELVQAFNNLSQLFNDLNKTLPPEERQPRQPR